jgi:hypothetical protein
MKKQLGTIAIALGAAAGLMAQGVGVVTGGRAGQTTFTSTFQEAGTMGGTIQVTTISRPGGALVTGSPFSAREVQKTVQTLSDGTELENTHTTMFYRDSLGRTRSEPVGPDEPIVILDPVAALRITLRPRTKTAIRANAPGLAAVGRGSAFTFTTPDGVVNATSGVIDSQKGTIEIQTVQGRAATQSKIQPNTEDLGFQMQNGVMAQGTRTTVTIPQGQIGNNRDIHVVNERWYSKDLQMLVKSVNSDPRFGVTTYDLTNISQNAPDPTLFQIPTGYTVTEGPRRVVVGK